MTKASETKVAADVVKSFPMKMIPIADIDYDSSLNVARAGSVRTQEEIEATAQQIKDQGLLHAVTVRETPGATKPYALCAGFGRILAHVFLKRGEILCQVRPPMSARAAAAIGFGENLARKELTPGNIVMGVCNHYARVVEEGAKKGGEAAEIAGKELGIAKQHVLNLVRVKDALHPEIFAAFLKEGNAVSIKAAIRIAAIKDPAEQKKEWSAAEKRAAEPEKRGPKKDDKEPPKDPPKDPPGGGVPGSIIPGNDPPKDGPTRAAEGKIPEDWAKQFKDGGFTESFRTGFYNGMRATLGMVKWDEVLQNGLEDRAMVNISKDAAAKKAEQKAAETAKKK